jgi:hypothetical protein
MTRTKTTTAHGLGWQHQQIRRRLIANHRDGTPCWWCGGPMHREPARNFDGAALEADHSLARSQRGQHADRLLRMTCNRQRQDGSRDNLRPALTGAAAHREAQRPRQPSRDTPPAVAMVTTRCGAGEPQLP